VGLEQRRSGIHPRYMDFKEEPSERGIHLHLGGSLFREHVLKIKIKKRFRLPEKFCVSGLLRLK
jgi:hypothetical protein